MRTRFALRTTRFRLLAAFTTMCLLLISSLPGSAVTASSGGPAAAPSLHGPGQEQQIRQQHEQQFLREHSDSTGTVRPDLWQLGIERARHMQIVAGLPRSTGGGQPGTAGPNIAAPAAIAGVQWTQIGPAPLIINSEQNFQGAGPDSGQVTDIAIDPRNTSDQVIYIATNDGGIWKSSDGGTTWAPKTDFMPSLSMGAVALDPSNPSIVYAGTGNSDNNGFFKGVGIYKSIDGGDTWSIIGGAQLSGRSIFRIVVLPGSGVLLVATGSGLFRSADGLSFSSVLGGSISDLKLDTASSSTVFAAVRGQGIFRSTDSGQTFPTNLFTATNGAPTSNFGRISFAQSTQPDNQTLYASVEDTTSSSPPPPSPFPFKGLYKSIDGGANWARMAGADGSGNKCQCNYDLTVGVDPRDATRVYIGFQDLYRSTDGGGSFGIVGDNDIHDDNHALVFSPASHTTASPTQFYVGTDGGIARTGDGGNSWTNIDNGIATNVLRGIDIGRGSSANNVYTYGGAQDTGISQHRPGDTGTQWHLHRDGDGGGVVVDPADPTKAYSSDDGIFVNTTDGGSNWPLYTSAASGLPDCGGNFAGDACAFPLAVDPNNDAVVYAASGTKLFQSTDTGSTFTAIKDFTPANVTSLGMVKLDSNTLWVGLNNGTVQRTANALSGTGSTWTALTVTGAPGQAVSGVAVDPSNTSVAVVIYPGFTCAPFCGTNRTQHVFMTTDGGTTWSDISGTDGGNPNQNLPDLPLHSVVIDPGTTPHTIIVASDAGVMRSADNGATWQVLGVGLPTVDSVSLQLDSSVSPSLLRLGTYGRSAFELTAATGPLLAINANLAFGTVPVGGSATAIMQLFNVGSTDLHISSISRASGSADFSIVAGPATPVTLTPGEEIDYTIRYAPTVGGPETATFQINSDDPNQPARLVPASGTGGVPQIALSGDLNFGTVARGTSATRDVTVNNTGNAPLGITAVSFDFGSDPSFSVLGPSTPQTVAVGGHIAFTVQFAPPATATGAPRSGTLRISSDDALFPTLTLPDVTVAASGTPGVPAIALASNALQFGSVAVDDRTVPNTSDQTLRITNQASCPLCDLSITSLPITGPNAGDFTLVGPPALPAKIGAGSHLDLTVRFNPSDGGARTATLTVNSDDPAQPSLAVSLAGTGLLPAISPVPTALIFGPTVFDPVCSGLCGSTLNETITDSGQAELILDQLIFSGAPAFSGPGTTTPLTRVQPTRSFLESVTFHPTGAPARKVAGTLHVQDNVVSGVAPIAVDIPLCGESVGRGIRVLVYDTSGHLLTTVSKLELHSHGLTPPINVQQMNLPLTTIDPPTSCQRIQFQYENQNLPAAGIATQPGSYYTLSVTAGNKHNTMSFTLGVNEFKLITVTVS